MNQGWIKDESGMNQGLCDQNYVINLGAHCELNLQGGNFCIGNLLSTERAFRNEKG